MLMTRNVSFFIQSFTCIPLWHAWILDMKFTKKGAISINDAVQHWINENMTCNWYKQTYTSSTMTVFLFLFQSNISTQSEKAKEVKISWLQCKKFILIFKNKQNVVKTITKKLLCCGCPLISENGNKTHVLSSFLRRCDIVMDRWDWKGS